MGAMKVLVVEDDPSIAGQIARGLALRGLTTGFAATGAAACAAFDEDHYDAMVLDRLLPDMGGLAVLTHLREAGRLPPVLMLSALGSVQDRIDGLLAGADDYLAKPFDMDELSARLIAICRRPARAAPAEDGALVVGRLRLDATRHRAMLGEAAIELNRKQFSLLATLMRQTDQVVTRAMLLETVWGYAFDPATNIVESNLSRLRNRLQALGCEAIETRRGEGYVLVSAKCA